VTISESTGKVNEMRKFEKEDYEVFSRVDEKEERRKPNMKTKKGNVKAKVKKGSSKAPVAKDEWGFRKGSKSSQAISRLASGKDTLKATRQKFNTLSFGILLKQLDKNGWKVSEDSKSGLCSVMAKSKGSRAAKPPVKAPASGPKVQPAPTV
jgi:hypothetical protein